MRRRRGVALGLVAAGLLAAWVSPLETASTRTAGPREPEGEPYLVTLGTAQDGGLPQLGCRRDCCERARRDPTRSRRVTSLLLVDPASEQRWLFDASPDLPEQVELAREHPVGFEPPSAEGGRGPLFDGIFPTHAHVGHYLGLAWLGREAYGARGQRIHATERLAGFLERHGPWSLSVETGAFELEVLVPDRELVLNDRLSVTPFLVPHRDEFSDTVGFLIEGPNRSALYLPDIDKWARWDRRIEDYVAGVDVALLDGTFFGPDELPGRAMDEIPHPFIVESLQRFASLAPGERAKIRFTHLNHSNPVADPASPEAARVRASGMSIARDGDRVAL